MKKSFKNKGIFTTVLQLILLLAVFFLGGLLLPAYVAPYLAEVLPITTPQEAAREEMSIQVTNRNVNTGETFSIRVSDPGSAVRMSSFSYDCVSPEVSIGYVTADETRVIPCGTQLELPTKTSHDFRLLTAGREAKQLPIVVTLRNESSVGELSVVLATASRNIDEQSSLPDTTTATLRSFPTRE